MQPVTRHQSPLTGCSSWAFLRMRGAAAQVAPLRAACPPTARFIMVTATLAANVFAQLTQEFPGLVPAFGPGKHCLVLKPLRTANSVAGKGNSVMLAA